VEFSFMEILGEYRYPYYLSVSLSVYLSVCQFFFHGSNLVTCSNHS
jgi:hypothetical protein